MLSMKPIKSAGQAAHYFMSTDNNYYFDSESTHENQLEVSSWAGAGAKKLNLTGPVTEKIFTDMLKGYLPNGEIIGLQKDGTIKHRPGYDLTFSAPKSVSILALALGDKRFQAMHDQAVTEALKEVEKMTAQARIQQQGELVFENTNNLIIAKFLHDTSRELDPQLHTHSVIINATERSDGKWRALASSSPSHKDIEKNGFYERILDNQLYFGAIYYSVLAKAITDQGMEVERTGQHGMFEIKHFPEELLTEFSKRRQQIETRLQEKGFDSLKAADMATLDTRKTKSPTTIDRNRLQAQWLATLQEKGYSRERLYSLIQNQAKETSELSESSENSKNSEKSENKALTPQKTMTDIFSAKNVVKAAIEHLSEFNTCLSYSEVLTQAMTFSLGQRDYESLSTELDSLISNKTLISLDDKNTRFTSQALLKKEMAILTQVAKTKASSNAVAAIKIKSNHLAHLSGSIAMKESVAKLLKHPERLALVSFDPANKENGKNENKNENRKEFIHLVLNIGEHGGKTVNVLTPSRLQANATSSQMHREPQTLWRWLNSIGKPAIAETVAGFIFKREKEYQPLLSFRHQKEIIVIDQAEKLSYEETEKLIRLTERSQARIIFLQNESNRRSLAGSTTDILKKGEITTFMIKPTLHPISFSTIPSVIEIQQEEQRLKALLKTYKELTPSERNQLTIIVTNKSEKALITPLLREILKNQGELGQVEKSAILYQPVFMTDIQKKFAHCYQPGFKLRLYEKAGFKDYKVLDVLKTKNKLILETAHGKKIEWNPGHSKKQLLNEVEDKKNKQDIEDRENHVNDPHAVHQPSFITFVAFIKVFSPLKSGLAQGERLMATDVLFNKKIKVGDQLTVTKVNEQGVWIQKENAVGRIKDKKDSSTRFIKFINNEMLQDIHVNYHYVHTLDSLPHHIPGHIMANIKSYALNQDRMDDLARKIGNASHSLLIFTDNQLKARQKLKQHLNASVTAIDHVLDPLHLQSLSQSDKSSHQRYENNLVEIERKLDKKNILSIRQTVEEALAVLDQTKKIKQTKQIKSPTLEKQAVEFAIEKLSEREAAFKHTDILKLALEFSIDQLHLDQTDSKESKGSLLARAEHAIEAKQRAGELIKGRYFSDGTRWTTSASLAAEKAIIGTVNAQKNQVKPLLTKESAQHHLFSPENEALTAGQHHACHLILTSPDRFVAVQGYAGTGKSTMLITINALCEPLQNVVNHQPNDRKQLLGLAPTHKAVQELKEKGIEAQTFQSFLMEQATNPVNLDNKLIVLDESSMAGNKEMNLFLKQVIQGKGRAVILGDVDQKNSVNSGKPFDLLLKHSDISVAHMKDIVRQKTAPLKEAVYQVIKKDFAQAFERIDQQDTKAIVSRQGEIEKNEIKEVKKIKEIKEIKEKVSPAIVEHKHASMSISQVIAADYFSRTPSIRDQTWIITDTHKDKNAITEELRKIYRLKNTLKEQDHVLPSLIASKLEKAEYQRLSNYSVGQVLKLGKTYYEVTQVETTRTGKGVVHLYDPENKTHRLFVPEKDYKSDKTNKNNLEIYTKKELPIAIGERIRLTRTDKEKNQFANTEYRVKHIDEGVITLNPYRSPKNAWPTQARAKITTLDTHKLQDTHWDHAYTSTIYAAQSGTSRYVIAYHDSQSRAVDWRGIYVAFSRAEMHLTVYTDNKAALLKKIVRQVSEKSSALETVNEIKSKKPELHYDGVIKKDEAQPLKAVFDRALKSTTSVKDYEQAVQQVANVKRAAMEYKNPTQIGNVLNRSIERVANKAFKGNELTNSSKAQSIEQPVKNRNEREL